MQGGAVVDYLMQILTSAEQFQGYQAARDSGYVAVGQFLHHFFTPTEKKLFGFFESFLKNKFDLPTSTHFTHTHPHPPTHPPLRRCFI